MWTVNNLKNDLKRLKSLYNKEKDLNKKYELSIYIATLEETLTNFTQDDKSEVINQGLYFNALYSLPKYRVYLPIVRKFIKELYPLVTNEEVKTYSPRDYNAKDMYKLTDKFFNTFDDNTYNIYKRIDKEKTHRLNFTKLRAIDSCTYYIPGVDKFYINLGTGDGENDEDIIEAYIHEIGHIITARKNKNRYHMGDVFSEIESLFYEILSDKYLKEETGDNYFSYLEKIKMNYYFTTGNIIDIYGIAFNKVIDNLTDIDNPDLEFKKELIEEGLIKKEKRDIDKLMRYLISYICAIELAMIYKEDKKVL